MEEKMAEAGSTLTRHDLEAKIVKHSWEDEGFRKEFLADPAGAFVRYLEIPAKDLPKIVIHEESAGSWHIVLPAKPANANELTEQDLEGIAGASWMIHSWKAVAVAGAVTMTIAGGSASVSASAITLDEGW
jgi:hypothetical protein